MPRDGQHRIYRLGCIQHGRPGKLKYIHGYQYQITRLCKTLMTFDSLYEILLRLYEMDVLHAW
jgi:hypothetical protein